MGREVYHYILVAWDFVVPALSVDDSVVRYSLKEGRTARTDPRRPKSRSTLPHYPATH